MVQIDVEELIPLFQQGVRGNSSSFALLARKAISRLRKTDPAAAEMLIDVLGAQNPTRDVMQPVDADSRLGLLKEEENVVLEYEPSWAGDVAERLAEVMRERRFAAKLRAAGLEPMKALLFKGPPGVGKTLACRWLARELQLPLLTLDLATVMSSLLGKTGSNVRAVIDYGRSFPCVLLLDEFDSIAKRRDDERDVGELKRLVTVLLQAIDEWPSSSLLVAATNHPELLDPAVWRRFDLQIEFENPAREAIAAFLESEGVNASVAAELSSLYEGRSYADLRRTVLSARKYSVLTDGAFEHLLLEEALAHVSEIDLSNAQRTLLIRRLTDEGWSQRKIAERLGVSHPTVGRILKDSKQQDRR